MRALLAARLLADWRLPTCLPIRFQQKWRTQCSHGMSRSRLSGIYFYFILFIYFAFFMWKAFQLHLWSIHLLSCTTQLTNAHGEIQPKHLLITSLFWSLGNISKPYVHLYPIKEQLSLIGTAFIETTVNDPLWYCATIDCFSDIVLHSAQ